MSAMQIPTCAIRQNFIIPFSTLQMPPPVQCRRGRMPPFAPLPAATGKIPIQRKLRFIDAFKFMTTSLDGLPNNLSEKQCTNLNAMYSGKQYDLLRENFFRMNISIQLIDYAKINYHQSIFLLKSNWLL